MRHGRIDAPWLIDGPINGERFRLYGEKILILTLKPGDIVIADNLGSHKSRTVRHTIRTAGTRLLFLPNYSLDLNPIEQLLRKAATRTPDTVCSAIGQLLDACMPQECASYLTNSGYDQTQNHSALAWRPLCQDALQGTAMHVQPPRRFRYIAIAQFVHALDMFPAHPVR